MGAAVATFETLIQRLSELERVEGITPVDILFLPEGLHRTVRRMLKRGMTLVEIADDLGLSAAEALQVCEMLIDKGFLAPEAAVDSGAPRYRVRLARIRSRNIPLDL